MLLARLLSRIFKKNGIVLIDSQGQKYICGKPDLQKPLTIKLSKKDSFTTYHKLDKAKQKMQSLLESFSFTSFDNYIKNFN